MFERIAFKVLQNPAIFHTRPDLENFHIPAVNLTPDEFLFVIARFRNIMTELRYLAVKWFEELGDMGHFVLRRHTVRIIGGDFGEICRSLGLHLKVQ